METTARRWFTREEYFDVEEMSGFKHEFCDGQVVAMAGGPPTHNRLCALAGAAFVSRLGRGPCSAVNGDQRLETGSGLLTYPDGAVYCGRIQLTVGRDDTATNPTVVIEVLSPRTRKYDLGEKREHYETIPSLRDMVFVDSATVEVTHWFRVEGRWDRVVHRSREATLELRGVEVTIPVDELYLSALDTG